jgi:hypothetical protein
MNPISRRLRDAVQEDDPRGFQMRFPSQQYGLTSMDNVTHPVGCKVSWDFQKKSPQRFACPAEERELPRSLWASRKRAAERRRKAGFTGLAYSPCERDTTGGSCCTIGYS